MGTGRLPGSLLEGVLPQIKQHRVAPKRVDSAGKGPLQDPYLEGGEGVPGGGMQGAPWDGGRSTVSSRLSCGPPPLPAGSRRCSWEPQGSVSPYKASASMATACGYTPAVLNAAVHWNSESSDSIGLEQPECQDFCRCP